MPAPLEASIRALARQIALPWGGSGLVLAVDDVATLVETHAMPGWEIEAIALDQGVYPVRYLRNGRAIDAPGQARLLRARVAQVGLGGLGGSLLEQFLRLGIGRIRAADGDRFEATNLNRQALSAMDNLGQTKSRAALHRAAAINPSIGINATDEFLTPESLPAFLRDCNLAVDALGGLVTRGHLQRAASDAGIPLVTGALAGWTGYVAVVLPGQTGPADIMGTDNGAEEQLGCPAPAVNLVASLMAAQVVALLTGAPSLAGRMLVADLASGTFDTVTL